MIWLLSAAQFVGARGAIGMAVGAVLAAAPSYALGRWTEAAVTSERVARMLAEEKLQRTEVANARVDEAVAARLAADGRADSGGMSDDGFRRD